jgi:hypothetical protein
MAASGPESTDPDELADEPLLPHGGGNGEFGQ